MMCCYYPTTIVAIDDDADFLMTMNQHLEIPNFISYTSPEEAINSITHQETFKRVQSRLHKTTSSLSEDTNTSPEAYAFVVNLKKLHEEVYSYNRFLDTSVLIIDYYMGEINGVDVCKRLAHHPAKKILLTGGIDKEKVAIDAFNNGIIHRFINKSDLNFPTQIKQAITILQDSFFRNLTNGLIQHLPTTSIQLLQNPAYTNFTRNLQSQLNAVEYYLLDTSGSILYLDTIGNPTWLVIKSKEELLNYAQIAFDLDGPEIIVQELQNMNKIPFFFSESDYEQPISNWKDYLYDANRLPGTSGYYYSIISGHIHNNLEKHSLLSYTMFNKNDS